VVFNYLRHAIVLAAWLAALRTFSCSISRAPSVPAMT
jgi:hypothetical protein